MRLLTVFVLLSFSIARADTSAPPAPTENLPLVNQEGQPFQLYDLKGKNVVVSFIFTRCPQPKMCPLTMQLNKKLLTEWKRRKDTRKLQLLIVTFDPDFDTPERLKAYAAAHKLNSEQVTLATGNPTNLTEFASRFNVIAMPKKGSFAHNLRTIVLDPEMIPRGVFPENEWNTEKVLALLK